MWLLAPSEMMSNARVRNGGTVSARWPGNRIEQSGAPVGIGGQGRTSSAMDGSIEEPGPVGKATNSRLQDFGVQQLLRGGALGHEPVGHAHAVFEQQRPQGLASTGPAAARRPEPQWLIQHGHSRQMNRNRTSTTSMSPQGPPMKRGIAQLNRWTRCDAASSRGMVCILSEVARSARLEAESAERKSATWNDKADRRWQQRRLDKPRARRAQPRRGRPKRSPG